VWRGWSVAQNSSAERRWQSRQEEGTRARRCTRWESEGKGGHKDSLAPPLRGWPGQLAIRSSSVGACTTSWHGVPTGPRPDLNTHTLSQPHGCSHDATHARPDACLLASSVLWRCLLRAGLRGSLTSTTTFAHTVLASDCTNVGNVHVWATQLVTKMRVVEIERLNVKTAFQPHSSAAGLSTVWQWCAQAGRDGSSLKLDTHTELSSKQS